jgi:hypothetical protein
LSNITLLSILIIFIWLAAIAYYFYVSRQQSEIIDEIDDLREELDRLEGAQEDSAAQQSG